MDYEKKYNEALEKARKLYNDAKANEYKSDMEDYESIFPELAESEDERIRKHIIAYLRNELHNIKQLTPTTTEMKRWLAYLEKQKEQKPASISRGHEIVKPAEWSEEDEKDMAHIIRILDDCYVYGTHDLSKTDHENLVNKLKSLRPSWKPSEEQMKALNEIVNTLAASPFFHQNDYLFNILNGLREELKKLL